MTWRRVNDDRLIMFRVTVVLFLHSFFLFYSFIFSFSHCWMFAFFGDFLVVLRSVIWRQTLNQTESGRMWEAHRRRREEHEFITQDQRVRHIHRGGDVWRTQCVCSSSPHQSIIIIRGNIKALKPSESNRFPLLSVHLSSSSALWICPIFIILFILSISRLWNPPKVILPVWRFHGDEDEDGVWMREKCWSSANLTLGNTRLTTSFNYDLTVWDDTKPHYMT